MSIMSETMPEFVSRIGSFQFDSVPVEEIFGLAPAVYQKVAQGTGRYLPFFGNTIIYYLDDSALAMCDFATNFLYTRFSDSLAQPLPSESFHLTLHDLRASPQLDEVAGQILLDDPIISSELENVRLSPPITMVITAVFNLMNTSICIGLAPISASAYDQLVSLRNIFDSIAPGGNYTPHITLAYYRPEPLNPIDPAKLSDALNYLTRMLQGKQITLYPAKLQCIHFSSMADYRIVGGLESQTHDSVELVATRE